MEPDNQITKQSPLFVNSFGDISNYIFALFKEFNNNYPDEKAVFWFRGQRNHKWPLIPNIYRKYKNNKGNIELAQERLRFDFMNRKRHLIHKIQPAPNMVPNIKDRYIWLSLMQHYGYPTCLLDFSENLISSLMFALKSYIKEDTSSFHENTPGIWVLNPITFNRKIFGDKKVESPENYDEKFIPSMDQLSNLNDNYMKHRIAIFSPMVSDRIHAQQGAFVAFPLETPDSNIDISFGEFSLEKHHEAFSFLQKWIIQDPDRLSLEIRLMGNDYSDLFPEVNT